MIDKIFHKRARDLGGIIVGRVLPIGGKGVGPFVFFDHMGPADFEPGIPPSVDVRPHPHIGLATVTYLYQGEIMHRDSVGSEQRIVANEVNWMIAGRGITHSERFEKARMQGDRLHGIQAWVALPIDQEECAPEFFHHGQEDLPEWREDGATQRLIAGEAYGERSAVKTLSPMFYIHAELEQGARSGLPDTFPERAVYVSAGAVEIDGQLVTAGSMVTFAANSASTVRAELQSTLMFLGGEPLGPRFIEWNFVSSSKDRIAQAKVDWRAGRMKLPDLDNQEFIPLPEESH
jgi:redox-sensitive bicupin YhaK (pirin superfamily)